jgi:hypothetical protein
MVSIPIQRIILHTEIIPRKIAWWISEIVILIPQNAFAVGTCKTFSNIKSIKSSYRLITYSLHRTHFPCILYTCVMNKERISH